ncbi:MAG: PEGA domain-containing protein [Deltaproteobacteria bacterium]|nr:PEGA domain-containing protein [Deltaproteobacteria bacterium]
MSAALVCYLALVSSGQPNTQASSTPSKANQAQARRLVDEGNALFKRGEHEKALERFQEAYETFRSPKILLNIAETHRALRDLPRAVRFYDQFLFEHEPTKDTSVIEQVRDRLKTLEGSVGRLLIECSEDSAEVIIDDEPVGSTPMRPWAVAPGDHRFSVSKPGFETHLGRVVARAGESTSSRVRLTPLASLASVTPPIPFSPPGSASAAATDNHRADAALTTTPQYSSDVKGDDGLTSKWWFWTGAALVAVGAAVSVAIVASSGGDDFRPIGELGRSATNGPEWTEF